MSASSCPYIIRINQMPFMRQHISILDQLSIMNTDSNYKRKECC